MNNAHKKAIIIFIIFVAIITIAGAFVFFKGVREIGDEESQGNLNIAIILNKAAFAKDEDMNMNIQNNDQTDMTVTNIEIQQYLTEKDKWKTANKDIRCPCYAQCEDIRHIISPGKKETFFWQQDTNEWKSNILTKGITLPNCDKVDNGIYRAKIKYFENSQDTLLQKLRVIYSGSFSIK